MRRRPWCLANHTLVSFHWAPRRKLHRTTLRDGAVVGQELPELAQEVPVVRWRVAVGRLMTIPRREVNAKLQAGLPASVRHLSNGIALPPTPWALLYGVLGVL